MKHLGLTAVLSDKDSGFVLMKVIDVSALDEVIWEGKGIQRNHYVRHESAEHVEASVEVGDKR